jgi:signal transduction histidine kinase
MLPTPLIESAAIALIGSGVTLLLGLWYLRREAQKVRDEALALSHANTWNDFDALRLPAAAWPILQQRFVSMAVEYEWFGMRRSEQFGSISDAAQKGYLLLRRNLSVGDITIDVFIWQKRLRGEQGYFASTLWEIFILLLQMDLWIKSATISSALEQSAKALTFVRHDAKNYIQLVSLLMGDISRLQPAVGNDLNRAVAPIIKRMQDVVPMMEARSKALLAGLGRGTSEPVGRQMVKVADTLRDIAQAYDLSCQINGSGEAFVDPRVLESIVENLLKNFADHGNSAHPLMIEIIPGDALLTNFTQHSDVLPDAATLLHMFEPFWTSSAAGLGLGLYQARLQAREQGGDLNVSTPGPQALCFSLTLPGATEVKPKTVAAASMS